jgi:hypothetical protein
MHVGRYPRATDGVPDIGAGPVLPAGLKVPAKIGDTAALARKIGFCQRSSSPDGAARWP